MRIVRLAAAYLASRPLLTALNVAMLALGVATITFLLLVTHQAEERLARDAKPVDLVVGAKGSPLQLILSTVFHADVPTGNIGLEESRAIAANPMVASATPLALGDSFRGHRIVGHRRLLPRALRREARAGPLFAGEMEAVVGSEVARRHGLAVGAQLTGAHGLAAAGPAHDDHPYRVVGILAPTGTVVDRLVLTSVESVWHVHEEHAPARKPEITALLIRYAHAARRRHASARDQREHGDAGGLAGLRERAPARSRGRRRRRPCSGSPSCSWRAPRSRSSSRSPRRCRSGATTSPCCEPSARARVARGAHAGRRRDAPGGRRYTGPRSRTWRDARAGAVARRPPASWPLTGLAWVRGRGVCSPRRSSESGRSPASCPRCRPIPAIRRASSQNDRSEPPMAHSGPLRRTLVALLAALAAGGALALPAAGSRRSRPAQGGFWIGARSRAGRHGPLAAPAVHEDGAEGRQEVRPVLPEGGEGARQAAGEALRLHDAARPGEEAEALPAVGLSARIARSA